jgi:hypothetical protein
MIHMIAYVCGLLSASNLICELHIHSYTIFTTEYLEITQIQTCICRLLHHLCHIRSYEIAILKKLCKIAWAEPRVLNTVWSGPVRSKPGRSTVPHGPVQGGPNSKNPNPSHRWPPGAGRSGTVHGPVRSGPIFFYKLEKIIIFN